MKLTYNEKTIKRMKKLTKYIDTHWVWIGKHGSSEYGQVRYNNKMVLVHRLSAHLFLNFDLASKLFILHKTSCPYKRCWNPECLYEGTHEDNMNDFKSLTKCSTCGRPFDKIYEPKLGRWPTRKCSICANRRKRAWYIKKKKQEMNGEIEL